MVRGKNVYRPKRVFKVCLELTNLLSKKESGKKGRPAIYPDHLYLALLILRSYFNWTYRETEAIFRDLFPEKPCPSFQALHWYMKKKLGEEELLRLLELLKKRLCPFLKPSEILILDSTEIPHRGKTQELGWMRGRSLRIVRGHSRLCLGVRYLREHRLLLPVGMSVGEGYAPDPLLGAKALRAAEPGGTLLADAGFDSGEVFDVVQGRFAPMINLKGGGEIKDPRRKEARKAFLPELYRLRGVGEGVFGGLKTRLNGRLRNLLSAISQKGKPSSCDLLCFAGLSNYLFVVLCHRQKLGSKEAWPQGGGLARDSWGPGKVVIPGDECPLLDKPMHA